MIDPARPAADFRRTRRDTRIPPVPDPWAEGGDNLLAAKGVTLALKLSIVVWLAIAGILAWVWAS